MHVVASKEVHMIKHSSRVAVFFSMAVSCDLLEGRSCELVRS